MAKVEIHNAMTVDEPLDPLNEAKKNEEVSTIIGGGGIEGDKVADGDVDGVDDAISTSGESELETETELEDSEEEESAPDSPPPPDKECTQQQASQESISLNDAFMALENMRKANLEVEYGGKAIPNVALLHQYCTACLQEQKEREEKKMKRLSKDPDFMKNPNNERRRRWAKQLMTRIRTKKRSPPCLICSSPVCRKHCCEEFRKEKITVCGKCSQLFTMDFVIGAIACGPAGPDEEKQRRCIAHMIECYDRSLLILKYSAQYIDEIADALENRSRTSDHIGLGSSGVGLMSGFTGVAAVAAQFVAAAAILSPAGPPLVLASIFFGASAAAASTGTEAVNYYSEPNQLACKIIALYDLTQSLLGVTSVLKDAIVRGHIDPRHFTEMRPDKKRSSYWKSRVPQPVVETVEEEQEEKEKEVNTTAVDSTATDGTSTTTTTTTSNLQDSPTSVVSPPEEPDENFVKSSDLAVSEDVEQPSSPAVADTKSEQGMVTPEDGAEAKEPEANAEPGSKPKAEECQCSLADIDDDDNDEEPVAAEKKEESTETVSAESSSLPSDADIAAVDSAKEEPAKEENTAPEGETAIEGASSTAAVMVAAKESSAPEGETAIDGASSTAAVMVATKESSAPEGENAIDGASSTAAVMVAANATKEGKPTSTAITIAPSNKRTAISRAMTNSMKVAAFASIACVMLSAATIIMETKNLRDTLESLRKGSPCEKAAMLRKIKAEIEALPETSVVAEGCDSFVKRFKPQAKKEEATQDSKEE